MAEAPRRSPPRMLEVVECRAVTPHLRRLVLGGEGLRGLTPCWPAAHIKLFFPLAHQRQPQLPTLDSRGRPLWPPHEERPVVRTYSARRHDPARLRLEVDFVLHEPRGPAAAWAAAAAPGDRVGMAGPGGPAPLLPAAPHYLMAGDLSALPAMAALLEALPISARGLVFIQVPDPADIQQLHVPHGIDVTWLIDAERDLVNAVRACPWPGQDTFVWVAGEGGQVVAIRDWTRERHGVQARDLYAIPYWRRRQTEEQYHAERHRVMDELDAERP